MLRSHANLHLRILAEEVRRAEVEGDDTSSRRNGLGKQINLCAGMLSLVMASTFALAGWIGIHSTADETARAAYGCFAGTPAFGMTILGIEFLSSFRFLAWLRAMS